MEIGYEAALDRIPEIMDAIDLARKEKSPKKKADKSGKFKKSKSKQS